MGILTSKQVITGFELGQIVVHFGRTASKSGWVNLAELKNSLFCTEIADYPRSNDPITTSELQVFSSWPYHSSVGVM